MKTKKIMAIVLFCIFWGKIAEFVPMLAQTSSNSNLLPTPSVIPSSPQSQIFEKYLNHEISEYNGLPEINIPLYEIETKGLKIPIVLSYHAGGVKHEQYDGEIGTGWSLNAGGYRITRTIHGYADEEFPLYNESDYQLYTYKPDVDALFTTSRTKDAYFASMALSKDANFISGLQGVNFPIYDMGNDRFTFNLPSSAGHFIITDRTNKSIESGQKLDKIVIDDGVTGLKLENMKITDSQGNIYLMGKNRNNILISEKHYLGRSTAWPVNYITTAFGEEIRFTYKEYEIQNSDKYASLDVSEAKTDTRNYGDNSSYTSSISSKIPDYNKILLVDEIITDQLSVKFERYDNSTSLSRFVKKIVIKDKNGNTIRTISFAHQPRTVTNWHDQLTAVTIDNKVCTFNYYPGPVGNSHSTLYDQWGYYLGKNNNNYNYKTLPLHEEFKNDDVLVSSLGWYETKKLSLLTEPSIFFVDRTKNESAPNYFSLKSITYPTGGTTEYIYESNQYFDPLRQKTVKGCGQRIAKIISKNNTDEITTLFKYGYNEDGNGIPTFYLTSRDFANEIPYFELNIGYPNTDYCQMRKSYMADPLIQEKSNTVVRYEQISSYQYNSQNSQNNGKIVSSYDLPEEYRQGMYDVNVTYLKPLTYNLRNYGNDMITYYNTGHKPLLKSRIFLNNQMDTIQKQSYNYFSGNTPVAIYTTKIDQKAFFKSYLTNAYGVYNQYEYVNTVLSRGKYEMNFGYDLLTSKETSLYNSNGVIKSKETHEYNDIRLLKKTIISGSNNKNLKIEYKYPSEFNALFPYGEMVNKNILSPIVEKWEYMGNTLTKKDLNKYSKFHSSLYLPSELQLQIGNNAPETRMIYTYDTKGNTVQITQNNSDKVVYLWGYNYQYPIAEIKGASYADVTAKINDATLKSIAEKNTLSPSDSTLIGNLRDSLTNALVTTYTYKPLVGVASITDPRKVTIRYEYDNFGRLTCIRDDEKKVIEKYEYNYKQ